MKTSRVAVAVDMADEIKETGSAELRVRVLFGTA